MAVEAAGLADADASDVVAPTAAAATAADGVWIGCTVAESVPSISTGSCVHERF